MDTELSAARRRGPDPGGVLRRITTALMGVRVRAIALPQEGLTAWLRALPHAVLDDDPDQAVGYESACSVAEPLGLLVLDGGKHARVDIETWLQWLRPPGCTLAVFHAADLDEPVLDGLLQSAAQSVARSAPRPPPE